MDIIERKYEIWRICKEKADRLFENGISFGRAYPGETYLQGRKYRVESAVNCRYLHRGYYCPSPVQDLIVDNARRGRLLVRSSKNSKITHRYYFSDSNKLMMVEATLPDSQIKREFLVYEEDRVFGFAFDSWGSLVGISEEVYMDGQLINYFCGSCLYDFVDSFSFGVTEVIYESYIYGQEGLTAADWYFSGLWCDQIDDPAELNVIIQGGRYYLVRENEVIKIVGRT